MKLKPEEINGAIRFSFSYETTREEIDKVVDILKSSIRHIRKMK